MKTAHDLVLQAKANVREITLQDAEEAIRQSDVLLDVREADEFAAGHLPGAVLVPRGLLEFKLSGTPALSGRDLRWCCIARPAAAQPWPLKPCRAWVT